MSAQESMGFDIRKWEVAHAAKFDSVKGVGNNWVEIVMPKRFIFGCYIHVRDLLFTYGNIYDAVELEYLDIIGNKKLTRKFGLPLTGTSAGKAGFIDKTIKPTYNHRYYYRLLNLPNVREEYGLYHKLHYRMVTKEEIHDHGKTYSDYFERRMIDKQPFWDVFGYYKEPVEQEAPIFKYVCYVCRRMYGMKDLYTFVLDADKKKHHICKQCYDDIPIVSMESRPILLKKV